MIFFYMRLLPGCHRITIEHSCPELIILSQFEIVDTLEFATIVCQKDREQTLETFQAQTSLKVIKHSFHRGSRAIRQLTEYRERTLFLRGIIPQLGFPSTTVSYERQCRKAGETKYPFSKMLVFAVSGITSVSVKPIRLVFLFGLVFILIATGVACWAFWCMYTGRNVSGWVSLILSIWFVGGSILAALGLIGEYIGNIFLDVKQRPRYNITEVKGDFYPNLCG